MRCLFFLFAIIAGRALLPAPPVAGFIDPTGTYTLTGIVKKNRITGHSGELRVLLLDSNKVAMSFYINKGYPGYESGAFMDTLSYDDNQVSYSPVKEAGCRILFHFRPDTVAISQIYTDPHSGCGFAPGVLIATLFKKTSGERPVIQDLSSHGVSP